MRTVATSRYSDLLATLTVEVDQVVRGTVSDVAAAHALLPNLEDLRYNAPEPVAKLAVRLVKAAPNLTGEADERISLAAEAMGIFASTKRLMGKIRPAGIVLRRALALAGDLPVRANLLQRSVAVLILSGRLTEALQVTETATRSYLNQRDLVGLGRVLVSRGCVLFNLGHFRESSAWHCAGLRLLPAETRIDRASALQMLGLIAFQGDDFATAYRLQIRALRMLDPDDAYNRAQVRWLLAATTYRRGSMAQTELLLRQARSALTHPFDRALVTLDLIEVLIERGQNMEAVAKAKDMAALLQPFQRLPMVEGAILVFVRAALAGDLTEALVNATRSRLQQVQHTSAQ